MNERKHTQMKKLPFLLMISMGLWTSPSMAQDLIYSQFNAMPLTVNPAFAGNNSCNYRLSAIGRSQWLGVNNVNSYQSATLAGDFNLNNNIDDKLNLWGLGMVASYDKSGVGNYTNFNVLGNIAYHLRFGREANNFLSFGIQAGAANRGAAVGNYIFDDQIDPYGRYYANTNENIIHPSIWYPEMGFGALLTLNPSENTNLYVGTSIFHILNPNISYTQTDYKLPSRINFHAGANLYKNGWLFLPSVYIQNQNITNYNIGGYVGRLLVAPNEVRNPVIGYLGVWLKSADAIAAAFRLDIGKISLAFSYDIHTGGVSKNLNSIGSPELSINYFGCFGRDTRRSGCPSL